MLNYMIISLSTIAVACPAYALWERPHSQKTAGAVCRMKIEHVCGFAILLFTYAFKTRICILYATEIVGKEAVIAQRSGLSRLELKK